MRFSKASRSQPRAEWLLAPQKAVRQAKPPKATLEVTEAAAADDDSAAIERRTAQPISDVPEVAEASETGAAPDESAESVVAAS